jgi:predicted SprT family Zn-dependent metalloprotease
MSKRHEELPRHTPTAEAYSELQHAYDRFNAELFEGRLPPCLLTLQRKAVKIAGYFSARRFGAGPGKITDEIAINPLHFHATPAAQRQALQTIVHEMCHLWQHHFGEHKSSGVKYHNAEWAEKMQSIGLMPSSTGKPGGATTGQRMGDYPIEGGRFLEVAGSLMAEGWRLTWRDRLAELAKEAKGEDADGEEGEEGDGEGEGDEKKSGKRIKYTCAATKDAPKKEQHNIWGKDSIAAQCLTCNAPFERVD